MITSPPRPALGFALLILLLLTACARSAPAQPTAPVIAPVGVTPVATTPPAIGANPSPSAVAKPPVAVSPVPARPLPTPSVAASPVAAAAPATSAGPAPAGSATHGQQVFVQIGCAACHGTVGQGASTGPRLAPGPLPFGAFQQQVRQPRQDMPRFTAEVFNDQDLADVYAYMQSIQPGLAATSIPLLNR